MKKPSILIALFFIGFVAFAGGGYDFPCEDAPIFGQTGTSDGFHTYTGGPMGSVFFDDYWGVDEAIEKIEWWGYTSNGGDPCTPSSPKLFYIAFYTDDGGQPDLSSATPQLVAATWTTTGQSYGPYEILKFSISLLTPLAIPETGWIYITPNSGSNCDTYAWIHSNAGNNSMYSNGMGGLSEIEDDLGFCLYSAEPVPLADWSIYLGIFLIGLFAIYRFRRIFV